MVGGDDEVLANGGEGGEGEKFLGFVEGGGGGGEDLDYDSGIEEAIDASLSNEFRLPTDHSDIGENIASGT